VHLHTRVELTVAAEDIRQRGEHPRSNEADVEKANLTSSDAANLIDVVLHAAQGALRSLEEYLSGSRKFDGA